MFPPEQTRTENDWLSREITDPGQRGKMELRTGAASPPTPASPPSVPMMIEIGLRQRRLPRAMGAATGSTQARSEHGGGRQNAGPRY